MYAGGLPFDQLSAMPSVHVAWSVLIGYYVWKVSPSRWRFVGPLHAVVTIAVVVVTANHWWADGIVAVALLVVAAWVATAGGVLWRRWRAGRVAQGRRRRGARRTRHGCRGRPGLTESSDDHLDRTRPSDVEPLERAADRAGAADPRGLPGLGAPSLLNICAGLTASSSPAGSSVLQPVAARDGAAHGQGRADLVPHPARRARLVEPLYDPALGQDYDFDHLDPAEAPEALRDLAGGDPARADEAGRPLGLRDDLRPPRGETMSLRLVYVHMIAEYARHNGHADLMREAIDGVTGR